MSDEDDKTPEPFVLLTGNNATLGGPLGAAPPRLATQSQINERLGKLENLADQVLKRIGQMALMVDGFGGNLNRRIDVLHEEAALLRASVQYPANDNIPVTVDKTPVQKAAGLLAVPVKFTSHAVALSVVLRLIGKHMPEYEQAIDSFLKVFGL